jgi:alcohol dehydrogenase YqhD (iron-dependent ADH family)
MIDFNFVSPTKIIFGHGAESKIGALLKDYGFKNVLLVYGSASIKLNGLYGKVVAWLDEADIHHEEISGVRANPSKELVTQGVALALAKKCDAILAIGGGSVIDTAKSIGVGYYYKGDPFDFNLHVAVPKKSLPVGVILTIASAGSELSNSCVISDDTSHIKQGFNSDIVRPLFAIEDPELTYSVPAYQTACGVSDIMMHSLERYFAQSDDLQLADEWALDLIKNTMIAGKQALKDPHDYEARAALMLDSSLSHNGLTGLGKPNQFVVHPLEHALSGYRSDITHGAGVALLYPAWAEYVYKRQPHKFAHLAKALFKIKGTDELQVAIMGIDQMRKFFASIGMPTSFKEVGLTKRDLPNLVNLASGNGTRVIGCYPQSLDAKDIEAIYASLVR